MIANRCKYNYFSNQKGVRSMPFLVLDKVRSICLASCLPPAFPCNASLQSSHATPLSCLPMQLLSTVFPIRHLPPVVQHFLFLEEIKTDFVHRSPFIVTSQHSQSRPVILRSYSSNRSSGCSLLANNASNRFGHPLASLDCPLVRYFKNTSFVKSCFPIQQPYQ